MNCEHVQRVLDAFLDGELDTTTHADVLAHLPHCDACSALKSERDVLRLALQRLVPHGAPPQLRAALERRLDDEDRLALAPKGHAAKSLSRLVGRWRSGLTGTVGRQALRMGAGVLAGFLLGLWVSTPRDPGVDLREPVIALHVGSFENGVLRIDVASSDRHVVKPWFAGKVDFAPTVRDLSADGFELLGGRLDTLDGQPAAVLSYRIRRHQISLFIVRSAVGQRPMAVSTLRGFSVATWAHDGLGHAAVSDVDPRELRRFAELIATASR